MKNKLLKCIVFYNVLQGLFVEIKATCNNGLCDESLLGDNVCDSECLSPDCNYDLGDCCKGIDDCPRGLIDDGTCHTDCLIPQCAFDWGDCSNLLTSTQDDTDTPQFLIEDVAVCARTHIENPASQILCPIRSVRNDICDAECNIEECHFDRGVCEIPTSSPVTVTTQPTAADIDTPNTDSTQSPVSVSTGNPTVNEINNNTGVSVLEEHFLLFMISGFIASICFIAMLASITRWKERRRNLLRSKKLFMESTENDDYSFSGYSGRRESISTIGNFPMSRNKMRKNSFSTVSSFPTTQIIRNNQTRGGFEEVEKDGEVPGLSL